MTVEMQQPVPVLRIYDVDKAKEFYVDFLGFTIDWEHRFEPELPLYMQLSHGSAKLHLSQHYGDGTPGTAVYIQMDGIHEYLAGLLAKRAGFARPGVGDEATLTDPFGNMLRFHAA